MKRLFHAFQLVKKNLERARLQQKQQYDKRAKNFEYQVGDKVLLDVRAVIPGGGKVQLVHVNRIKPLLEAMICKDDPCPEFRDVGTNEEELSTNDSLTENTDEVVDQPALPEDTFSNDPQFSEPFHGFPVAPPRRKRRELVNDPVQRPERPAGLRPWTLVILLLTLTLKATDGFEKTICDCSHPARKGFIEFNDEDCKHLPNTDKPNPIHYTVLSTLPVVQSFMGHTCSMWKMSKSVYRDFMQWDSVTENRIPLEVSSDKCRKMRDSRLCDGAPMDILGSNKWSLEKSPHVQGSWLRTNADSIINCRLEEVVLETECTDCVISSPLGVIPGKANGSLSHNLVTIVWDNSLKEPRKCKAKQVEEGLAMLYTTATPGVLRVRDSRKQLDFIVKNVSVGLCETPANNSIYKEVLGMDRVVITWYNINNNTQGQSNGQKFENISSTLRAEIDTAAHSQHMRDFAVEMTNSVAKKVPQYNGWLAAAYLDLPQCNKLQPVGKDLAVLQCIPRNITFTTEITRCGPQPRYKNQTISVEGWELTDFTECYWHFNFVNFNGRSHTYKNGTWTTIEPSIIVQGDKLINPLPLEVDNTLGTLLQLHPALKVNPLSPAAAMADIFAAVQQHHSSDFTSNRHVTRILLSPHDAPHISFLSRIGSWLKNFVVLSGIGILVAVAFRFCGLSSIFVSRGEDIELGVNVSSRQPANAPINIINMPTGIPTGAPQTGQSFRPCQANRAEMTDQEALQQQAALLMKR
uniref:Uncharacterized protein n=1 Tax=Daphnia galeata TaxID=27404 RepID=A0A8J2WK25_9CRUS|nr:unnamed protein product [Daphnia galeata]